MNRDVASSRLRRSLDRFEQESEGFHDRVADTFDGLAAAEPARWLVVDGGGTVEEVTERLWATLEPRLAEFDTENPVRSKH